MRKLRLAGVNRLDQSGHRRTRQSQDSSPYALSSYGPCRKKRRHPVGETGIDIKKRQREVVRGCEDSLSKVGGAEREEELSGGQESFT